MNCEDFRRELESAVENRTSPEFSEAREHLKHCSHCRALWEDYDIVERAVAEWVDVDNDAPDLSGRVLAVLSHDRDPSLPPRTSVWRSRMVPLLAGLSAVALLFLAFYLNPPPGTLTKVRPVSAVGVTGPPLEPEPDSVEMDLVLSDTRAAYDSLVNQVTEPFQPLKDEVAPSVADRENAGLPESDGEKSESSVPPELAGLQSEVMRPLGFLTAVFSPSSPAP